MTNLLVPIGSGGNAENTLRYAIDFAKELGAKIYVTQIYESTRISGSLKNIDAVLEEDSKKEIQNLLNKVDTKGVEVVIASIKGRLVNSLEALAKHLEIDLIVSSAKSISTDESLYLGKASGKIVKDTKVSVLVVPAQYRYKSILKILMAVKSGKIKSATTLNTLKDILSRFSSKLDLLQVITPHSIPEEAEVDQELKELSSSFKTSENATVFQGVLEHLHDSEPDMLCVIRRQRGFFTRLWKKDAIKKRDFESRIPLLVLKGVS